MKSILDQLDEAEKAATPGPWGFIRLDDYHVITGDSDKGPETSYDAELIALSRNNIRALIDVARAIKKRRDYGRYPSTDLHDEMCPCMHATMNCNCGADEIYKALSKLGVEK